MSFGDIPEVDINILLRLNDQDLFNTCQTNVYFSQVCRDPYFWRERIRVYIDDKYTDDKPEGISWRNWYLFWRNNYPDLIGDNLNLSPSQAAIRIMTEKGIVIGSEAFQDISLTLEKAFESRNVELVTYFMSFLNRIKRDHFELNLEQTVLRYKIVIPAALKNGFTDEATYLLRLMLQDINRLDIDPMLLDTNIYNPIVQTLGQLGMVDYFNEEIPIIEDILDENTAEATLIIGLLEGGYREIAYQRLQNFLEKDPVETTTYNHLKFYQDLVEVALEQDDEEIVDLLNAYLPNSGDIDRYQLIYDRAAWKKGHGDQDKNYHDVLESESIFYALAEKNPEKAWQYITKIKTEISLLPKTCYQPIIDYAASRGRYIELDFNHCSLETILGYITHPNIRKNIVDVELTLWKALYNGRYDLAKNLPGIIESFNYSKLENRALIEELISGLSDSPYKDLYLDLILWYRSKYLDADPLQLPNRLENYLLTNAINKTSDEQLIMTDFHSLLLQAYISSV